MSKITSADCKRAIVEWVREHPGHVSDQFVLEDGLGEDEDGVVIPFTEEHAMVEGNWKRMSKETYRGQTVRGFDCLPYDAQLRAYVTEDGTRITNVTVTGE